MKIKLAGWIVIAFLLIIVASIVWYIFFMPKPVTTTVPTSNPTLPVGGSVTQTPISTSTTQQTRRMTVELIQGGSMVTNDFLNNGVTIADPSNQGHYYLTGTSANGYAIGYRAGYFTIALEQEPLGQTRMAAENFLLAALGVSQNQLCSLKYYIGTDVHTNSLYAGKNLGFSFCPGATKLPQ